MISIIDYGAGNIESVKNAFNYLGANINLTDNKNEIMKADKIILPGVGSFEDAMLSLKNKDLDACITDAVKEGIPLLGICLGMQVLFEFSEEGPGVEGLNLIKGRVTKLKVKKGYKVPHMGWNSIKVNPDSRLLKGLPEEPYCYFVHSYCVHCEERDVVTSTTEYSETFHSVVERDNLFACQFHPEKSGVTGLEILKNFIRM